MKEIFGFNVTALYYRKLMRIEAMAFRRNREPYVKRFFVGKAIRARDLANKFTDLHQQTVKLLKGEP